MSHTQTVDVSNRSRVSKGTAGAGRFANEAPKPQGTADLSAGALVDDVALDEARRVYATAEERRVQATGHSIRAGVNLLTLLAQSKYPDAAELRFRHDDGRDTIRDVAINDADGHDLWAGAPSAYPEIDEAADQVTSLPVTRGDLAAADIQVLPSGEGILPISADPGYDLDALERLLG